MKITKRVPTKRTPIETISRSDSNHRRQGPMEEARFDTWYRRCHNFQGVGCWFPPTTRTSPLARCSQERKRPSGALFLPRHPSLGLPRLRESNQSVYCKFRSGFLHRNPVPEVQLLRKSVSLASRGGIAHIWLKPSLALDERSAREQGTQPSAKMSSN